MCYFLSVTEYLSTEEMEGFTGATRHWLSQTCTVLVAVLSDESGILLLLSLLAML